jgi:hypothetical protein
MWESWLEPPEHPEIDCDCGCEALDECECDTEPCGSCGFVRCACDDMYEAWRAEQD